MTTQSSTSTSTSAIASALSLPYLNFSSESLKPVKLTLTPHHLFYLLSRFEELAISVGPMNVRLENIHTEVLPGNYVSFLGAAPKNKGRSSDADSMHSVSSVRSALSSMSSMWSRFTLNNEESKLEKQKAVEKDDLKYLYSAFTKIPCLRLAPDPRSKLIAGYQEFPFDTAVPLFAFKNVSALEICDLDFRQMYGWDRLAEQLRSLTIKRGSIDDLSDLLVNIVLDDMDKRRRRSSKHPGPSSPATPFPAPSPSLKQPDFNGSFSSPTSPINDRRLSLGSPQAVNMIRNGSHEGKKPNKSRQRSNSPARPTSSRHGSAYAHPRSATPKLRRSSGSDSSSVHSTPRHSSSNLLTLGQVHTTKWRFLKHLSLADNGLTYITANSLVPLASTLHSLDLSDNLFTEIPDSLSSLTNLRALNLSNCMITSLHSLARSPLPAITVLNLRSNRLTSLVGIERLFSLEKIDLRDNKLTDPTELARLTRIPDLTDVYVHKNPFVRTHPNFRVTIFNLFRSSPGYAEDIRIDSAGPSYNERKMLVDRVPEPEGPVVRPLVKIDDDQITAPQKGDTSKPLPALPAAEANASTQDSGGNTAQRRRKPPRRRIVELSEQDSLSPPPPGRLELPRSKTESALTPVDSSNDQGRNERSVYHTAQSNADVPRLDPIDTRPVTPSPARPEPPELVHDVDSPDREPEDIGVTSDTYRQKIEALKNDFGNSWLTALSEDKLDRQNQENRDYSPAETARSDRTQNIGVAIGGRTLG